MNVHFETPRLILRDIELSDVDGMFALDSDPDVHRYLGNEPISKKSEAEYIIGNIRQQYIDNGIARWAVIEKETNEFVGWTGLKVEKEVLDVPYYDLGYRFRKKFWGQGIATETSIISLRYGFNELKLKEICAGATPDNIGSNKVLQKVGLKRNGEVEAWGMKFNWYTITEKQWRDFNN